MENKLIKIISKIPKKKIGLLFSGGIDSLTIAYYLKQLNYDFTCYTVGLKGSSDLKYAKEIAKELDLKLKTKIITQKEIPSYLEKVVPLIGNTSPVQVSIATTIFIATELAKKDNVDLIVSGTGADELFGGYARHLKSEDLNKDLKEGLKALHNNDVPRERKIMEYFNLESFAPFLRLEKFAMKLPASEKISEGINKYCIRKLMLGKVSEEYALRKKTAAQYGSKLDKAISKLAGKSKTKYLNQFFKLGVLFSSGKDSCYATQLMKEQNYNLSCLITIKSSNKDSYMYHTPNIDLVSLQSESMEIPLLTQNTTGLKEDELEDLEKVLIKAKKEYGILGVVTGALFSKYQASRIESICDKLNLKCFNPLWHKDQEKYMKEVISKDFEIIFSSIAADGLSKEWLGKKITLKDVEKLIKLNSKIGLNVAGEGGEFESLVLNCPLFKKKIKIQESDIQMENEFTGKFIIKKAKLT
jgi:diphthine-ammonia ligase